MKIWMTSADDYGEKIINQLMCDEKLKFYQGNFYCLNNYSLCAEWKYGIVLWDGVDYIFYISLTDELIKEFDGDIDELQAMFRDDFDLFDEFYNELFMNDFEGWIRKVWNLHEENKKWIH